MSIRNNMKTLLDLFRNDETLLRLLFYKPKSIVDNIPDPLSPSRSNILEKDEEELWQIRDEHIFPMYKDSDLKDIETCRIHVYAGNRVPTNHNYTLAEQDFVIDIFSHESYEKDYRLLWVTDRLNELLFNKRITGITKIKYDSGRILQSPSSYSAYRHVYTFESGSKK